MSSLEEDCFLSEEREILSLDFMLEFHSDSSSKDLKVIENITNICNINFC